MNLRPSANVLLSVTRFVRVGVNSGKLEWPFTFSWPVMIQHKQMGKKLWAIRPSPWHLINDEASFFQKKLLIKVNRHRSACLCSPSRDESKLQDVVTWLLQTAAANWWTRGRGSQLPQPADCGFPWDEKGGSDSPFDHACRNLSPMTGRTVKQGGSCK